MASGMNLAEMPVDVLLDIFGKIDREDEETNRASIRTILRLVCRRFNKVISDPNNQRRLSAIRMKVNKITIAQFGSALAIRLFHGNAEDLGYRHKTYRERIYCFPEDPLLKIRKYSLVDWRWEDLSNCESNVPCEGSQEFFETFAQILSQFQPKRIEFAINITRSFLSSLIECLRGYPRIERVNLDLLYDEKNEKFIKTQPNKDIDDGTMKKFASNFYWLERIPKRFLKYEFIDEWINGTNIGDFHVVEPIEENEEITPISLRNFSRVWIFESTKLSTTFAELLNAIELRIKNSEYFDWEISLSDEEKDLRKLMLKNNLNYQVVLRFNKFDTQEGLKLKKSHKFNGGKYEVRIIFCWKHERGCYHAICRNHDL